VEERVETNLVKRKRGEKKKNAVKSNKNSKKGGAIILRSKEPHENGDYGIIKSS